LVPYWAKDEKIGFKTINARSETVEVAYSFRSAFKKRRCLIPADGFYEWKKVIGGKIPYSIEMKDSSPFVFAGLREGWQKPETQEWLRTCTTITRPTSSDGPFVKVVTAQMQRYLHLPYSSVVTKSKVLRG
jgi:putative SOS response-associated peptidase YedK